MIPTKPRNGLARRVDPAGQYREAGGRSTYPCPESSTRITLPSPPISDPLQHPDISIIDVIWKLGRVRLEDGEVANALQFPDAS